MTLNDSLRMPTARSAARRITVELETGSLLRTWTPWDHTSRSCWNGTTRLPSRRMLGRVRRQARGSRKPIYSRSPKRCDQEQIRRRELQTPSGTSALTFLGR